MKLITVIFLHFFIIQSFVSQSHIIDSLKKELKKPIHDTTKCEILMQLSEIADDSEWSKFNFELEKISKINLEKSNSKKLKQKFRKYLAKSYNNKGFELYIQGDYKTAKFYHNKALELSNKINDIEGKADAFSQLGIIAKKEGNLLQALEYYQKGAKIEQHLNKLEDLSYTLNNIGAIHFAVKDNKKALEYFNKCIAIQKQVKDSLGIAYSLINIGTIFLNNKEFDKSLTQFEKANQILIKINDKRGTALALNYIADIYFSQKKYNLALNFYSKSLELYKEIKNNNRIALVELNIAKTYFELNQYKKSRDFVEKSIKKAKNMNSIELLKDNSLILYKLYKKENNNQKALLFYEQFVQLKDSITNTENKKNVYKSQIDFEYDLKKITDSINFANEKNKAIAEFKSQNELQKVKYDGLKKQNQLQWILNIIIVIFFIISISFVVFYIKKYKEKNRLSNELENSLIERNLLNKEIHHRVKNNLQIISSLINLQKNDQKNEYVKEVLQQSQNRIQSMALIHEKLYQSGNLKDVKLKDYLSYLMHYFSNNYDFTRKNISFEIELPDFNINSDQIIPLGLIANELILNSIKYGMNDLQTIFTIKGDINNNVLILIFKDNGKGFPENWSQNSKKSLGMNLIQGLTKQLKGKVEFFNLNGANVKIEINLN